ncbi:MAG: permease prefix domain 1-containing protein [Leucobacter sp.]
MNVITAYLDTMFSAYPATPRMLEAKAELRTMMEDAYTNLIAAGRSENEAVGQVIRDFGNIAEVAPVLGITSEIAPQPAPAVGEVSTAEGTEPASPGVPRAPQHPAITMEEARGYADAQHRIRFRVSVAVALFVLSPILLIVLPAAAEAGAVPFASGAATAIGLLVVLVMVAIGVVMILSTTREMAPYARVSEGRFSPDPEVSQWAEQLAQEHERGRIRALQVSVVLWVLSPAPLLAFALLLEGSERQGLWSVVGVALVLILVAAGLAIFLPAAWARSVADRIGGSSSTRSPANDERSIVSVIAAIYWPLLTAIYLAWSFIGNAWGISWVVWPIGAVLFGAIAAGASAWEKYRRDGR